MLLIPFLALISLLFLFACGPKVVEHTITITRVPERITPPSDPVYTPIPDNIHIGSKKAVTIIWKNFLEAERARKEALAAFFAYDSQVKEMDDENN